MSKLGKLKLCLMVLPFVFFLNFGGALGQEGCIVPTITKNVKDIQKYLKLKWAPNNPDTVKPYDPNVPDSGSVTISVIDGKPDFTWQVSGNDFWFDANYTITSETTSARSITLYAGPDACGPAEITVTDPHSSVIGYVRCTAGQWITTGDHVCTPPCEATVQGGGRPWCGAWRFSCISGNLRYCYVFCPSPCQNNCPPEICAECGPNYYYVQEWSCP